MVVEKINNVLIKILPPFVYGVLKRLYSYKYGWRGKYSSWAEAEGVASGYDAENILDKVSESLLKVKNGEAVFERDSVLFDEIQYSWPIYSGLLLAAAKNGGKLDIIDFGGSLGSSYFQNKKFLDQISSVSWNVIEQGNFVKRGKELFADDRLHFYHDVDECKINENPNVLMISNTLQYIESPYELLDSLIRDCFDVIIFDKTLFTLDGSERVTVQVVPPWIYNASYPCHILSEDRFKQYFILNGYKLVEEFNANVGDTNEYRFKGFIFVREIKES